MYGDFIYRMLQPSYKYTLKVTTITPLLIDKVQVFQMLPALA